MLLAILVFLFAKLLLNELDLDMPTSATSCQIQHGVLKNHHPAGNDLETVLLHKSAFLRVTPFFRLSSFGYANALLTGITKTFAPFYSSFPEILCKFVLSIPSDRLCEKVNL